MRLAINPWAPVLVAFFPSLVLAQSPPHQTDFPPEEFQARWNVVFDRIGDHAVAIVQGAPKTNGFLVPRQSNEFYYLCGIETPHAYLILNGKDRKATVVLPPRDARLESAEGKVISSTDADLVKQITGAAAVLSSKEMTEEWMRQIARRSRARSSTPARSRWPRATARAANRARKCEHGHHVRPMGRPRVARGPFPIVAQVAISRRRDSKSDPDPR